MSGPDQLVALAVAAIGAAGAATAAILPQVVRLRRENATQHAHGAGRLDALVDEVNAYRAENATQHSAMMGAIESTNRALLAHMTGEEIAAMDQMIDDAATN